MYSNFHDTEMYTLKHTVTLVTIEDHKCYDVTETAEELTRQHFFGIQRQMVTRQSTDQ